MKCYLPKSAVFLNEDTHRVSTENLVHVHAIRDAASIVPKSSLSLESCESTLGGCAAAESAAMKTLVY